MKFLFTSQKYSDFSIMINDEKITAHKFILAANSSYFKALFQHHTKESQKNQVIFTEENYPISASSFKSLLYYFYTGITEHLVDPKEAIEILLVEELFDLKEHEGLLEHCQHILDDCIELKDCLVLLQIASKWNQEDLVEKMTKMAVEHYKEIEQDPSFKTIDPNLIQTIQGLVAKDKK